MPFGTPSAMVSLASSAVQRRALAGFWRWEGLRTPDSGVFIGCLRMYKKLLIIDVPL